jgi:RHS repeat-associated protein
MGRGASWLAHGSAGAKNRWYPAGNCWGKFAYTLGPTGIRTKIDEADGTVRAYEYDDLYRLTKETVTGGTGPAYEKSFAYDAVSNRISQVTTGTGAGSVGYTYDSRDRLMSEGGTAYGWTDNGNLMSKAGEASYEWDFEDRLTRVVKADGTVVENMYDVDGVMVRTAVNGVATDYLVDTSGGLSHVVAEIQNGAVGVVYVRAGDMLLEEIRGGVAKMHETDGLGSVRGLLDLSGERTDSYSYEAFGSAVSITGSDSNPYRFAGERLVDSAGLYQNRARWLDSRTGRFVSVDPLGGDEEQPLSMHRYLYAWNDPVDRVDPSGWETLPEISGILGGIGILARTSVVSLGRSIAASRVVGIATGGAGYMVTRGRDVLRDLALTGWRGVYAIQQGILNSRSKVVITRAEALSSRNWVNFDSLKNAVNQALFGVSTNPAGQEWHHIVGQHGKNLTRFGGNAINSMANVVCLPEKVHGIVTQFYSSSLQIGSRVYSHGYDYVGSLSWERQYKIGLEVLRQAMSNAAIDPSKLGL